MTTPQYQKAVVVLLNEIKKELQSGFERLEKRLQSVEDEIAHTSN